MGAWGTSIFSDDLALDIRREYNFLLSVGKDNFEIESMLQQYYKAILNCNDPDEDIFWYTLALCEWKKGRLSSAVKEKALLAIENGRDLERWNNAEKKDYIERVKVLNELRDTILSPMMPISKVKKPTFRHCPWKIGSLLAYRIISNQRYLENHPCNGKYLLLRIIKINKRPISKVCPSDYYNESMLVGLYDWIGDDIPSSAITDDLTFISIDENTPHSPNGVVDFTPLNSLSKESAEKIEKSIVSLFKKQIVTCAYLDWQSSKGIITYLGCDDSYCNNVPDFFNTSISACPLTTLWSFDILLAKRMKKYFDHN